MDTNEEKIIREWIEKAKPIVDSAWNLALDQAIMKIKVAIIYPVEGITGQFINKSNLINELLSLKKEIK